MKWGETIKEASNRYRRSLHLQRPKTAGDKDSKCSSIDHKQIPNPLNTPANMMLPKEKQNRFQLSFKAKEVPVYMPMEKFLMDDLDIPIRTDTYKIALKNLYRQRKQTHLEITLDRQKSVQSNMKCLWHWANDGEYNQMS